MASLLIAVTGLSLLAPSAAEARAGRGFSMGSRGSHTWSAPPRTSLTPHWARPMDRTYTPRPQFDRPAQAPSMQRPLMGNRPMTMAQRPGFVSRHPFMTGFMGGLLGAGLFGMLSGHGILSGFTGGSSLFGFLLQVLILALIIRWLIKLWQGRNLGAVSQENQAQGQLAPAQQAPAQQPFTPTPADYNAFSAMLVQVETAWGQLDMNTLQRLTTPEMYQYFSEQLDELSQKGLRNHTGDVRFIHGDLSEAWIENGQAYATVAMQYSLLDYTVDAGGTVVDGSRTAPQTVTEDWTFVRPAAGGTWRLSAIQQAG
ncbi:Tim44 domain-containing protein [Formicincola oecophyllae]|uniref:Tim44 domain-containing protein n=2 Tax=Formicincola oecophyllae TaxID=2558361 RepID=A0A4Y6UD85_9PROT|nr:Tim44 domain-containing protein [Formicincola oecophyllae]